MRRVIRVGGLILLMVAAASKAGAQGFAGVDESSDLSQHCPFKPGDGAGERLFSPQKALSGTPCVGGFAGEYPCRNVDLVSFLPLAAMGCTAGNSLWGWTDHETGKEYALMGCNNGIAFVDLSTPESPYYLGKLPTHTINSAWRDVRVYADHAFVISEASGHGMQVFDLTRLRNVVSPPVFFTEDAFYGAFGHAHTIDINEETGFAYPVGSSTCSGGPHMVNIQDPTHPVFAGCVGQDGYTHETQCVVYRGPDAAHTGRELCFSSNEDTLTIVDVTQKSAPMQLSRTSYTGSAYVHQGWLTDDQRYFIVDDELDEIDFGHNTKTYVFNVSEPEAPVLAGIFTNTMPAIDHNQYVKGGYLFQADYRSGLHILSLAGVSNASLTEEAYFDIYPPDDAAHFNGAWNNYPFFESGLVIVSGIEQGLYVLRPTSLSQFNLRAEASLSVCQGGSGSTPVSVTAGGSYVGSVTLSTIGLPAGVDAEFSANPVVVPGMSTLTVTESGLADGTYTFTLHGTDGTGSRDTNIGLTITSSVPAPTSPTAPPNGATNQPAEVTLKWTAVSGASEYGIEVATDPQFTAIVYSQRALDAMVTSPALESHTLYYWRVKAHNGCGDSSWSPVSSFTTRQIPPILLVDDDDDSPDVRAYYTAALDAAGASYDVWNTENASSFEHITEPGAATLASYRAVIWFSGDAFNDPSNPKAGPTANTEGALASFLDQGHCLLLSSQDYFFDRGDTVNPFMSSYLGLGSAVSDVGQSTLSGAGAVFGGLGPYQLAYPPDYGNFADQLTPALPGVLAFNGDNGGAAVMKSAASFKTAYFGFGLEGIPDAAARGEVMERFLGFCGEGPGEPVNLSVSKSSSHLVFKWTKPQGACSVASYALYRGSLGSLASGSYSHDTSLGCEIMDTIFQTPLSNPSIGGADYFLVVAESPNDEGTYGTSSAGAQRPVSAGRCKSTQDLTSCF